MFWGSVKEDLLIMLFLCFLSFLISLGVLIFSKKKFLGIFLFSFLTNLSIYSAVFVESFLFRVYDLVWLQIFAVYYWPIINLILFIILIFQFFRNVSQKK